MIIRILHKGSRNQLVCTRSDGSVALAELGPSVPYHDIAHFVAEDHLGLKNGFYGNIAKGMSVAQLSDKEVIKKLPAEAMAAEIITRALQSLWTGACTLEQFIPLVETEFATLSIRFNLALSPNDIPHLLHRYDELITQWKAVKEGGSLEMRSAHWT